MKQQFFCIINKKAKTIIGYERKLTAVYAHAGMRYRPFIAFKVLDSRQLAKYKGYALRGDLT